MPDPVFSAEDRVDNDALPAELVHERSEHETRVGAAAGRRDRVAGQSLSRLVPRDQDRSLKLV